MERPIDFSLMNKSMDNVYLQDHMYQMCMNMNDFEK